MQETGPSLGPPMMAGSQYGPVFCFVGTVHLPDAEAPSPDGVVAGRLTTNLGVSVPLVQSSVSPLGAGTLAAVKEKTATVCGPLFFQNGQLAVDVAYVSPGSNPATPGVSNQALVTLALLGLLPTSG